jgi:hypothetical protein
LTDAWEPSISKLSGISWRWGDDQIFAYFIPSHAFVSTNFRSFLITSYLERHGTVNKFSTQSLEALIGHLRHAYFRGTLHHDHTVNRERPAIYGMMENANKLLAGIMYPITTLEDPAALGDDNDNAADDDNVDENWVPRRPVDELEPPPTQWQLDAAAQDEELPAEPQCAMEDNF